VRHRLAYWDKESGVAEQLHQIRYAKEIIVAFGQKLVAVQEKLYLPQMLGKKLIELRLQVDAVRLVQFGQQYRRAGASEPGQEDGRRYIPGINLIPENGVFSITDRGLKLGCA
jgi:hypothetical protein